METRIKSLEKGAADKDILNKFTIVSLEGKCNTLADRIKEANDSTKSAIEEKAEERKSLKAELYISEGLVSQLEIELAANKKEIFLLFDKASDVEGNMKNEVQIAYRAESDLLVARNLHLELEEDFVEKSVKISELLTQLGIQLNQIKVQ